MSREGTDRLEWMIRRISSGSGAGAYLLVVEADRDRLEFLENLRKCLISFDIVEFQYDSRRTSLSGFSMRFRENRDKVIIAASLLPGLPQPEREVILKNLGKEIDYVQSKDITVLFFVGRDEGGLQELPLDGSRYDIIDIPSGVEEKILLMERMGEILKETEDVEKKYIEFVGRDLESLPSLAEFRGAPMGELLLGGGSFSAPLTEYGYGPKARSHDPLWGGGSLTAPLSVWVRRYKHFVLLSSSPEASRRLLAFLLRETLRPHQAPRTGSSWRNPFPLTFSLSRLERGSGSSPVPLYQSILEDYRRRGFAMIAEILEKGAKTRGFILFLEDLDAVPSKIETRKGIRNFCDENPAFRLLLFSGLETSLLLPMGTAFRELEVFDSFMACEGREEYRYFPGAGYSARLEELRNKALYGGGLDPQKESERLLAILFEAPLPVKLEALEILTLFTFSPFEERITRSLLDVLEHMPREGLGEGELSLKRSLVTTLGSYGSDNYPDVLAALLDLLGDADACREAATSVVHALPGAGPEFRSRLKLRIRELKGDRREMVARTAERLKEYISRAEKLLRGNEDAE